VKHRLSAATGLMALLLGMTACSSSGHTPSGHAPSASATPSGSAQQGGELADPNAYGKSISGAKTLLNTHGKGNSSLSVNGAGKSGDLVIAISCRGNAPLKATDKSGRLLLRIDTCSASPQAVYNSRGSLRPADVTLGLTTGRTVDWRIAVLEAPHSGS